MTENCIFSYFMTEDPFITSSLPQKRQFGKYALYTDATTPFLHEGNGEVECAIFGLCVNVISGDSDNIAHEITEQCTTIDDVVSYEKNLGGKYVILFKNGEQYYIQGDATCSIPVFYNTEGGFVCSSNSYSFAAAKKYSADVEYAQIRKSGDISQAMPYDITPYREIKQLIPNHYLDINNQKAVRFINAQTKQKMISVDHAAKATLPMIDNILALYLQNYKIYCPITSGRDSRVVLAFLMKNKANFDCYTIKHPEHNDTTQDIVIPIELCKKENLTHLLVEDVVVPEAVTNEANGILGEGNYSPRTLRIAQTVKENFGDGAIINGDIIGQVGKCSLHRDIPALFATPSYFRCKLHNYSRGAKKQLRLWLKEIRKAGEKTNPFDLFSIENRMGRWAGQENLIYNTLGQAYLNIFNSRSIIYTWTAISRKERKKSALHLALIRRACSLLMDIPFEKDEGIITRLSKSTWLAYLLSSYAKFFLDKRKYKRGY